MPREPLAHRQIDLLGAARVLGLREVGVLLDAGDLAAIGGRWRRGSACGTPGTTAPWLPRPAAARPRRLAGAVGAEGPLGVGGLLVDARALSCRSARGPAGARCGSCRTAPSSGWPWRVRPASRRARSPSAGLRSRELAVELVRRAEQEAAREGLREARARPGSAAPAARRRRRSRARRQRGGARTRAGQHVVAGRAGDAVAGERAVARQRRSRVPRRPGHGAGVSRRNGSHSPLAAKRSISNCRCPATPWQPRQIPWIVRPPLSDGSLALARELRVEDRVATAEPHRRGAPRRVRREIEQVRAVRVGRGHVELQPGGARVVAAEALRGGDELAARADRSRLHPHLVVGLRGIGDRSPSSAAADRAPGWWR